MGIAVLLHRKVQDGPKTSISFGVMAEPPDLPCREDVLVEDGATSPEVCLPFLEMRSSTAAGGLVPIGETSIATETTAIKPLLQSYSSREENSEKKKSRTSTPHVSYDSSAFQDSNLPAAPYCRRVVETKSRQNRTFAPGGSQGQRRACPFSGSWRALVVVRSYLLEQLVTSCSILSEDIRWLPETRPVLLPCKKKSSRLERLEVISRMERGHVVEGDSR